MLTKSALRNQRLTIKTPNNETLTDDKCMRILGFLKNTRDSYDLHLGMVSAVVSNKLTELKPLLDNMSLKNHREVVYSKVASTLLYGIELYAGQNTWTQNRMHSILMRCNRAIHAKPTYMVSIRRICDNISVDPPELLCQKAAIKYIHKIISTQRPDQIYTKIRFNRNQHICSKLGVKYRFRKEISKKNLISIAINLYNGIDSNLKYLQPRKFNLKLKKLKSLH